MDIKKAFRLLLKIPATPFVVVFCVVGYLGFQVIRFFEWVYEADKWDQDISRKCVEDSSRTLRKWFTQI